MVWMRIVLFIEKLWCELNCVVFSKLLKYNFGIVGFLFIWSLLCLWYCVNNCCVIIIELKIFKWELFVNYIFYDKINGWLI